MLVLVETISTFRHRYVVDVPDSGDPAWALDTVVMNEATEFSQKFIDESVISHRVVTQEEALKLCDEDNGYASTWSAEKKMEVFFSDMGE
jgi:hypothetical protein